mgnify:FL=1|jgi:ligand-binding sensor protein
MKIDLKDVITKEFQQEIQDSFAYATGFGVVFVDRDGKHIGKGSNFTKFCREINSNEHGRKCCELSNRRAISIALETRKPCIYICHAGMINIEIPLIVDDYYVGAITAGQVLCDDMTCYPRDPVSSEIDWLKKPIYNNYFKQIKVLSKQQIEATTTALLNLSNYILQMVAYTKMQQELSDKARKLLISENEQIQLKNQLMYAKLNAFQKQVTPHFIFNVLNSISRLISMKEYDIASHMLDSFAQMMRYSLSNAQSTVSLKQEIGYIENYLAIQKIRFGDRLSYNISCDPYISDIGIPFFSLQPLVENSIEHGILNLAKGGHLDLKCKNLARKYLIIISDNGIGINEIQLAKIENSIFSGDLSHSSDHLGLRNCYSRLKFMFGDSLNFKIASKEGIGTTIAITISK